MNTTLAAAAEMMHGSLHGDDASFDGVCTDTRTLEAGQLFVALSGPNFDAHDFIASAAERGAAGAVVSRLVDESVSQIIVDDTLAALGRLGSAWRELQPATVIGITGSNGKTTLKELTAACLQQVASTLATQGNLNNEIGMPLMLTRIDANCRFAVIEMGANHIGEIGYLTSLAQPDVVAITNAGPAHLEGFGSIEGVAAGKGEILDSGKPPAAAVLNADDRYFDYWCSRVGDTRVISFGRDGNADVYASGVETQGGQTHFTMHLLGSELPVALPLAGRHNVINACAAAAIATALDVPAEKIKAGLESVAPVGGRLVPLTAKGGATLYDDSYNANPVSVTAAGEFLAGLPGRSWFVLGDMKELGDDAMDMHREVGVALRRAGIDRLAATGELCRATVQGFGDGADWYADVDEMIDDLSSELGDDVNILVKGSRSMRMERVVQALEA
ncbi:MAG: UDP-N-acetylmuramoyl-tripeptide--D-alanyl-D-alanine ligase [Woeseiaceae bacterium]|nr:UDP-N-acetylmuramoyl-tripeptide--D-alanyl-D-alanine ligase [Woeseiaceae bacterium]